MRDRVVLTCAVLLLLLTGLLGARLMVTGGDHLIPVVPPDHASASSR